MSVRNLKDSKPKPWLCECYPQGRAGKRIRKRFTTRGEAITFERFTMKEVDDKPWLGDKPDHRRLSEIIELWYKLHGKNIKSGAHAKRRMMILCEEVGDPIASLFSAKSFVHYRANRKTKANNRHTEELSPASHNYDQSWLQAVFNYLIEVKEWKLPNPMNGVKPIKLSENELTYLSNEQICHLLEVIQSSRVSDQLEKIVKICISTGARVMEAVELRGAQLAKCSITFTNTKGKRNRTLPITQELYDEIYQPTSGRLFSVSYGVVHKWITRAFPDLPKGQSTHVLRHTFASHLMMNGCNILTLQKALGHTDIKQTMVYAHLSPDHLIEVRDLNPLNQLSLPPKNGGKVAA
ncbi:tyrosine-type recombinase/integrase [Photobacterium sagamiensis]|uniref:phage integrase n=1 Tax=Photobacterium sagamiensis TaxID=2910241 RepID=UPI003D0EE399